MKRRYRYRSGEGHLQAKIAFMTDTSNSRGQGAIERIHKRFLVGNWKKSQYHVVGTCFGSSSVYFGGGGGAPGFLTPVVS